MNGYLSLLFINMLMCLLFIKKKILAFMLSKKNDHNNFKNEM